MTMTLPKDLKAVKKRIRAERIFIRILMCAVITLSVLGMLAIVGYFAAVVAVLSMMPSQGRSPLPPVKPKLKYARMDCLNDIRYFMSYERFEICKDGNTFFLQLSELRAQNYD